MTYRRSAFGHKPTRLSNVTDGTSNTVFSRRRRYRARPTTSAAHIWTLGAVFMNRFTPNGTLDYYGVTDPPGGGGDRLGDGFCVSEPAQKLPLRHGSFPLL